MRLNDSIDKSIAYIKQTITQLLIKNDKEMKKIQKIITNE